MSERAVHRAKKGTLKRGKGGRGGKVKSRKQAIAIGLSEARKEGKKVPKKKRQPQEEQPEEGVVRVCLTRGNPLSLGPCSSASPAISPS